MSAGDNSPITFVEGGIAAGDRATTTVGPQAEPGAAPSPGDQPPPKDLWPFLAAGCSAASMIAARLLIPFDWATWPIAALSLIAIGLAAFFVQSLHPRRSYRLLLSGRPSLLQQSLVNS